MTYPTTAPAGGAYPLPDQYSSTDQLDVTQAINEPNSGINYAWKGVDTAPTAARFASTGTETYIIAAGSVTQISGTTIDGGSAAVNDVLLLKDCPATSGVGASGSSQPANGLYFVTAVESNLSVTRAATMSTASAAESPAGRVVFVGPEGIVNGSGVFQVCKPLGAAPFTYGTTAMQWQQLALGGSGTPSSGDLNIDGGGANSIYDGLSVDGGTASTVTDSDSLLIDGGNA